MTRRRKTKSTIVQNTAGVNASATAPPVAASASATVVTQGNTAGTLKTTTTQSPTTGHIVNANGKRNSHNANILPIHNSMYSSTTSSSTAASSNTRSTIASSSVSETASTSGLEPNDKALKKRKPRKPIKTKVSYVTKQVHIYPMYPILTVERLPNLEYYVGMLTESIGRRPRVYQHGKGVRFVPESNDEYRTIQRYLAKIESAERIAWCSYTVPPGNSLKVNVKVRVVEVIKITEDLEKLKLQNSANLALAKTKSDSHVNSALPTKVNTPKDVNTSAKKSLHKESNLNIKVSSPNDIKIPSKISSDKSSELFTKDLLPKDIKLPTKELAPKDVKSTTPKSEPKENKLVGVSQRERQIPATNTGRKDKMKKSRDIAQNRSYRKKTYIKLNGS